ncbi:hypothetical protein BGW36DRAFT_374869 [Talaromyces proteolyticus]|uniref:Uncharacterized protein n=1 Tax=Talaromyces proteolyticus TaxID=1131652 RepID=A0AAD4KVG7_9EURO|nr:uncharacterized protein BGW36DRAFT_374869 [Talaromyces proteolyticus]KAH8700734.1 hypothetical protein BGW36DRAFT_374869 [Talaromyces proteolyticus]
MHRSILTTEANLLLALSREPLQTPLIPMAFILHGLRILTWHRNIRISPRSHCKTPTHPDTIIILQVHTITRHSHDTKDTHMNHHTKDINMTLYRHLHIRITLHFETIQKIPIPLQVSTTMVIRQKSPPRPYLKCPLYTKYHHLYGFRGEK